MAVTSIDSSTSEPTPPTDTGAYKILVRQLVAHAAHAAPASSAATPAGTRDDGASEDVLFDCEVDGVRCVLVRAHPAHADALSLSPREHEVARMIAKGYPNKVIASVLDISVWTVSTYLRRIFAKLGVTSRTAMVARMFENGKL
jgi:DNA-binding CsgD family transcriptional regulator